MNPVTGEGKIKIAGKEYNIRFDWSCLAEIEAKYGDNYSWFDPDTLATLASIGFKKYHPELTAEKIKELSPPLKPFAAEVQRVLYFAYFGNEEIQEDSGGEKKSVLKMDGLWH